MMTITTSYALPNLNEAVAQPAHYEVVYGCMGYVLRKVGEPSLDLVIKDTQAHYLIAAWKRHQWSKIP